MSVRLAPMREADPSTCWVHLTNLDVQLQLMSMRGHLRWADDCLPNRAVVTGLNLVAIVLTKHKIDGLHLWLIYWT